MRGKKAREIRKFWRFLTSKNPKTIGQVLQMPTGQIVKPARLAYQRMKGRRMMPMEVPDGQGT